MSNKEIAWIGFGVSMFFGVIIMITLMALSFQKISEGEVGLEYRDVPNKFEKVHTSGIQTLSPDSKLFLYPVKFVNMGVNIVCVSRDGLPITITTTTQYSFLVEHIKKNARIIGRKDASIAYLTTNIHYALYLSCSHFNASEFTDKRGVIEQNMTQNIINQVQLAETGITTGGFFQLVNFDTPREFNNAVLQKQLTEQQIPVVQNQRDVALGKAKTILETTITARNQKTNNATSVANTILEQAQTTATARLEAFNKTIEANAIEMNNLGLNVSEWIEFKIAQLLGNSKNAYVSLGNLFSV